MSNWISVEDSLPSVRSDRFSERVIVFAIVDKGKDRVYEANYDKIDGFMELVYSWDGTSVLSKSPYDIKFWHYFTH